MRHPKYFIVHCLLYKVTFKGYNIVHNLATTNLNSVPISLLIVTKCDLGQEKKNAGATAGYQRSGLRACQGLHLNMIRRRISN